MSVKIKQHINNNNSYIILWNWWLNTTLIRASMERIYTILIQQLLHIKYAVLLIINVDDMYKIDFWQVTLRLTVAM